MNQIPWELIQLRTIEWVVIGLLASLFLAGSLFHKTRQQAPAMMTSIGILGTFAGIYVAMLPLDFSPLNMNHSVTALVNGMKTAFLTSLMGLGAAILFRFTTALGWHRKAPSPADDGVLSALSDIHTAIAGKDDDSLTSQISRLRLNVKDSGGAQEKALEGLLHAVGGSEEGSLAWRLDRMRLDVTEHLDQIQAIQSDGFEELKVLTETIRESVGKALTESLDRLIRDIEKALIEQFGKTFVEFNEATQALKKWQEDHRAQVEELTQAFNLAATSIESIAQNCAYIPSTMDRLQEGLSLARQDVEALNRLLEAFASLREQAERSFPLIKQNLDAIGDDLRESAAGFNDMEEKIEEAFKAAQASAMRTMETHAADVKEIAAHMKGNINEAQQEALNVVTTTMDGFSRRVKLELERITESWGGDMVAIAKQCKELIDSIQPGSGARGTVSRWRGGRDR